MIRNTWPVATSNAVSQPGKQRCRWCAALLPLLLRARVFIKLWTTARRWLDQAAVKTLIIAKGSSWENGYAESFNGKLRDELLSRELFLTMDEARWVIDRLPGLQSSPYS